MFQCARVLYKILFRFGRYRPQPVTPRSVWRWLAQFHRCYRSHLYLLLDHVIYYSEQATRQNLVSLNREVLATLGIDGIGLDRTIYVAVDTAGSSSHVMLNLLRDAENLERRGAKLLDSRDADRLTELTSTMGSGAIIYVDDFAGTGNQFLDNRKWTAQFIVGAFAEFFLAPVVCEEAWQRISESGVVPVASLVHTVDQRPLHQACTILPADCRDQIVHLCGRIDPKFGLGFRNLATMVVFYRNAPNTMPVVFRGSLKQTPHRGVFPRSDDLPF